MGQAIFNWKKIKLPTIAFVLYILMIPLESIYAVPIIVNVSYATIIALITSLMVLIYLLFKPKLVRLNKSALPWIAFFIWAGLSTIWTIDRSLSNYNFIFISKHLFFFILIGSYPFNYWEKRMIRHAIILSGIILSAKVFFSTYQIGGISEMVRATIANGNYLADPNHTSSSLLIPICFLIVDFVEAKKFKPFDAIAITILFITLVITGSRGSFTAFLAGVITFIITYSKFKSQKKAILAIVFSLAIIGSVILFYNPDLLTRFAEIENLDRYSANRTLIWKESWIFIKEKAFAGWGFATFPSLPGELAQKYKTAHNIFIQSFAEGGVIAFLLTIIALIPTITFRTYDGFSRATKAAVVAIFTSSFFLFTLNYDYFWLSIILVQISMRSHQKEVKTNSVSEEESIAKKKLLALDIR